MTITIIKKITHFVNPLSWLKEFTPGHLRFKRKRRTFEDVLLRLPRDMSPLVHGDILVDATWDNPNFWLRYSLLEASLGISKSVRYGLIGFANRPNQLRTLKRFGIQHVYDLDLDSSILNTNIAVAQRIIHGIQQDQDIFQLDLPYSIPAELLYDFILKRKKSAFVEIGDKNLPLLIAQYLSVIEKTADILTKCRPSLVIASHALSYTGPLVWLSLQKQIEVIIPYGDFGQCRYWRITNSKDFFDSEDRPSPKELQSLDDKHRKQLVLVGKKSIAARLEGRTRDLGSTKAYRERMHYIDRATLCEKFRWNSDKMIIAVYASSWFDYPHSLGMTNFNNFFDWITTLIQIASADNEVQWLFKPHPCDEWYGGLTLADMVSFDDYSHIRLADTNWNGAKLLQSVDAVITYHGTVGIEATSLGKPVLIADRGWYHDIGFVKTPNNRRHYTQLLRERWWEEMDLAANAETASIFAGIYWGRPEWQRQFILDDDSTQWDIYTTAPHMIHTNRDAVLNELETIRRWYQFSHPHYQTFKIISSSKLQIPA